MQHLFIYPASMALVVACEILAASCRSLVVAHRLCSCVLAQQLWHAILVALWNVRS